MTNLTPELRPDKNGKLVTRHVRADSGPSLGKQLPAPSLSAVTAIQESVTPQEIADLAEERGFYLKISKRGMDYLAEHTPETLRNLKRLVQEWPKDDIDQLGGVLGFNIKQHALVACTAAVALDARKMFVPDEYSDPLNTIVRVCTDHSISNMDVEPDEFHFSLIKADIIGKSIYLESPFRALIPHQRSVFIEQIRSNLDVLEPAAPVIAAIGNLTGVDEAGQSFEELMETAALVARHPGRSGDIARIIADRLEYDPDLIEQMMSSQSPSMTSGIL